MRVNRVFKLNLGLPLLSILFVSLTYYPVLAQAEMYCVGNQTTIQGVSPALDGLPCLRGTPPQENPQQTYPSTQQQQNAPTGRRAACKRQAQEMIDASIKRGGAGVTGISMMGTCENMPE
jgi:hypothetical protein